MEPLTVAIRYKREILHFEVAEYLHHTDDHCKFEVFANGKFAASFEHDRHSHLHLCKNAGIINENILNLLADKLETLPQQIASE